MTLTSVIAESRLAGHRELTVLPEHPAISVLADIAG